MCQWKPTWYVVGGAYIAGLSTTGGRIMGGGMLGMPSSGGRCSLQRIFLTALYCISECCCERWRRPTSRASLQGFKFSRAKATTGWCSCMCDISVLNVVYLVVGWSPLSRERGCCKLDAFIFTLLGCIVLTGRKFALQCGRSMVELSWVTMTDLIVFLCN